MSSAGQPCSFTTTRWSLVASAGRASSPEGRQALETLCTSYWLPLYAFVRRKGHQPAEAHDLTQAFFVELLEKDRLQLADQCRGRFRTFLLASLNHFMANDWRHKQAQFRGGRVKRWSLNADLGESRYCVEPADDSTPEKHFLRQWALTLLEHAVTAVRDDCEKAGKLRLFELLKRHLGGDPEKVPYRDIAAQLEMTEAAVKVAAHRLRQRCRDALRAEIRHTVQDDGQIDEELRSLFTAIEA